MIAHWMLAFERWRLARRPAPTSTIAVVDFATGRIVATRTWARRTWLDRLADYFRPKVN